MPVLTTASQVQCPHGGMAILTTTNAVLLASGSPVLLETDIHTIAGCPFTVGTVYSPCVTVQWMSSEASLTASGAKVLTATSIGKCMSAANAPQGIAMVSAPSSVLEVL